VLDLQPASFIDLLEPLAGSLTLAEGDAGDVRWWRFLGRLHPLTVHFPIGLALTAAAVELLNIIRRKREASPFAITATGIAAVTAIFAALFGWLNADFEGASLDTTLFLHRWLGIIAAGGLTLVFLTGLVGRTGVRITAFNGYRWGLIICSIIVAIGAHFGGEMVYGKGYLTKVLFPATVPSSDDDGGADTSDTKPSEEGSKVSFQKDVLPIFEARCVECHGPDKDKADLRLDSVAAIFSGDKEWWPVLPGDPDHSLLVERVELPEGHVDQMPPDGDRLTAAQIATIRAWIAEGADGATPPESPAKNANAVVAGPSAEDVAKAEDEEKTAAIARAVDGLRERGVLVMRIAQDTEDWEVNASLVSPKFSDDDVALLNGLQPVLAWANFTRTDLTDAGLTGLEGFDQIRSLRLAQTSIGDGGVDALLKLKKLEVLNLYASGITDAGILRLAELPDLKRLYCADTPVTPAGLVAALAVRDGLEIIGSATPPAADEPADAPSKGDE
jgi:uncharacterized membrane protein/mono/diheme cytochrome c family protein